MPIPRIVVDELEALGAIVTRKRGERTEIDVRGVEALNRFLQWLSDNDCVDSNLGAHFGNQVYPFVPPVTQSEVCRLLQTFTGVTAAMLDGRDQLPQLGHGGQMFYHYHHSQRAIVAVMQEIQAPAHYAAECPGILAVRAGNLIAELWILYPGQNVSIHLHRAT